MMNERMIKWIEVIRSLIQTDVHEGASLVSGVLPAMQENLVLVDQTLDQEDADRALVVEIRLLKRVGLSEVASRSEEP